MAAQTISKYWTMSMVLIYANQQENNSVDFIFFFFFFFASKEAYPIVKQKKRKEKKRKRKKKKKKTIKKTQAKVVKCAENKCWVHRNPLLWSLLSVKVMCLIIRTFSKFCEGAPYYLLFFHKFAKFIYMCKIQISKALLANPKNGEPVNLLFSHCSSTKKVCIRCAFK